MSEALTVAQINFFQAQILNETSRPATISSVWNTICQLSDERVTTWANDQTVHDAKTVQEFRDSIQHLHQSYSGTRKLESLLPGDSNNPLTVEHLEVYFDTEWEQRDGKGFCVDNSNDSTGDRFEDHFAAAVFVARELERMKKEVA